MPQINFDSEETTPTSMDFEPVPNGIYTAKATASEMRDTKSGTGTYLAYTFDVLDPKEHAGRKVFTNFNWTNDSEKAVQIGRGMYSALCRACGKVGAVRYSEDLHEIPVLIKVVIENQPMRPPQNRITAFYPLEKEAKKPVADKKSKKGKQAEPEEKEEDDLPWKS